MMERIVKILITLLVVVVLLYLSQFWGWRLWPRQGLFGIGWLRPEGNLIAFWLRGTPLASFGLVVWVLFSFLILTWTESLLGRIFAKD